MTSFNDCKISFRLLRENKHPSDSFKTDISGHENFKALAFHPKYDNIMITDEKIDGTATSTWINQNQDAKNDQSLNDISKYWLLFVKFKFAENEDGIESERWMAISHGEGHKFLDIDALEYGFGLHTALCLIDHEKNNEY
uniref:Uncharacterized protein n=1 Tax=Panagrolaimus superbus TaxID=310955 RepID=A0A914ZC32_9BILA